ncbi:MAG TPA: WD40 repeat domain-containing protein, partial [Vicinamibacterales bacterium]|nr:WD40 repeat domain-containing protein [Vicinamibacterales bacterium]
LAKMLLPVRRISMGGQSGAYVFSADRKRVAAATAEGVKVYDLLTGHRIAVLEPLPPMMEFKFSPDGKHFATGSGSMDPRLPPNYVAQVWRLEDADAKEIGHLKYAEPVHLLAFNVDGRYLATSADKIARVWEVGSESEPHEFELDAFILDIALSPDGGRLFTQTNRPVNELRDVDSRKVLKDVPLSAGQENIALSPDWRNVATVSDDSIRITKLDGGAEVARIREPNTTKPAFTADGEWLMASRKAIPDPQLTDEERAADQSMMLWDAHSGAEWFRVRGVGSADRIVMSPDRKYVATLSAAQVVQIWSDTDREVSRIDGSGVLAIAYAADGKLVTGNWEGSVQLWETTQAREAGRLPHGGPVHSMAYTPDSKRLLTNSSDHIVRVWDSAASRELTRIETEPDARVALDPYGKRFVSFLGDAMRVVDLETKEIAKSQMPSGAGGGVFTRDGKYLATAGSDNNVRLWAMPEAREVAHWPLGDGIDSLAFSPDGKLLAASTINSDVAIVWDRETRDVVPALKVAPLKEEGGYRQLTFSPDGRYLAASVSARYSGASPIPVATGAAVLWDTSTWKKVARLPRASGILAFSADSKLLATNEDKLLVTGDAATQEFNARIWTVPAGDEIRPPLQHPAGVTAGAFTADGARLVTASADGVRLWDLLTGREMFLQRD